MHTTASDYAKFLLAWLQPKDISQSSVDSAFTSYVILPGKNAQADVSDQLGWGLGWGLFKTDDKNVAWHWGDNGIFRAFVAIDLSHQTAIVYFANSQNGLAIAKKISHAAIGETTPIFDWLGYGQSDSEAWQHMRQGYLAESTGNYVAAIKHFENVIAVYPENQRLVKRIGWLETLQNAGQSQIILTATERLSMVGQYGVRNISLSGSQLIYQREKGTTYPITPITKSLFQVGDIYEFRLEAVKDEERNVVKLIGHYIDGNKDESLRSNG
ncbi:beta-lactamase family protein [Alteromonas sp. MYP5]|uniref:Beta-lactamase family protein n=1 Tax=Alteromonas ponticola TaxID=2720613 RepID=A0ABX1QY42_9ALTE|nr:beta-lactamase family protein [Alteromonas ponticola]